MTDPPGDTVGYYDRCAEGFAAQTADVDLEPLYHRFLRHVRPGGRILDADAALAEMHWRLLNAVMRLLPLTRLKQSAMPSSGIVNSVIRISGIRNLVGRYSHAAPFTKRRAPSSVVDSTMRHTQNRRAASR